MEQSEKVWIVTIDMQRMHRITRRLGIENVKRILEEIALYLHSVASDRHIFRTNNETFSVLALSDEEKDRIIAQVKERFSHEWNVQENPIVVTAALIVQQYPRDFSHVNEFAEMLDYVIEQAHTAANGSVFDMADNVAGEYEYERRGKVETALERALQEHRVEVFYQPIYSLKEKRIVSLEALARLKDEELGYIPPDEFIGLAEKNGSIIALGEQVLEESCRFLAKHVLSNDSLGITSIQVNVSVAQCFRLNLEETVIPIMEKYHIPPSMITLELTEGIAIDMPERMLSHMEGLGKYGIAFAMDDYGSGNSNCSYLIRFPFQEVKIDKEIVWAYFENETARIVLENEIRTLKELGRKIVVEGIESREQSDAMERLGVDFIQGYYYGKPLPEAECLRYIRNFDTEPVEYGKA
jgi:EAL domain-containing protein (putative c-di-GMP-specific phosphodiesterase class I)